MLFTFVILCDCDSSTTPTEETETGNYANGGLVAGKDNLVYFINPADYNKIYSYDEQSDKYERISDDSSHSIFIDGDWIYYEGLFNNKLSRIRLDGTVHEEIKGLPISYTDLFSYFVADGWIYYKWWDFDLVGDYDAREIMVYEGYIYFIKDNFELNRVSLDGRFVRFIMMNINLLLK